MANISRWNLIGNPIYLINNTHLTCYSISALHCDARLRQDDGGTTAMKYIHHTVPK